jgi:hypothetical protein
VLPIRVAGTKREEAGVDASRSQWGVVRGFVRYASGQAAGDCGIWGEPTTLAAGIPDFLPLTNADGSYLLSLPEATYTIKVNGTSASGASLRAEVAGVVVAGGSDTVIDITVSEDPD